jgi:hypothetical protein
MKCADRLVALRLIVLSASVASVQGTSLSRVSAARARIINKAAFRP